MWRLVDSGLMDGSRTAATDEAILAARSDGSVSNTLHLYCRDAPTVSLGYFQKASECVDLSVAREEGVSLVRRMSGGSAIYTDRGQLTYCLIIDGRDLPGTAVDVFRKVCGALVHALSMFEIDAEHRHPNDVVIRGRKISGSAQMRHQGFLAQHGTLLVDTDLELMHRVLRSPKRSRDDMTTMALEMGEAPLMEEVAMAVVRGFQETFKIPIIAGELTEREKLSAAHLAEAKYSTERHTFLR